MKTCSKCGAEKADENGRPECKACLTAYKAAHYKKNKEKYDANNRTWAAKNKEWVTSYNKEHYQANREVRLARVKKYAQENPNKIRNGFLKRTYGIGSIDYDRMLAAQGGTCAICQGPPTGRGAKNGFYYVDHDHATGNIRELLCHNCNQLLGCAKDDSGIVQRAMNYLLKHKNSE